MPCPHYDIAIIKRSKGMGAVKSAAYQSAENLYSEYDHKKHYNRSKEKEVFHKEILLPAHAPPEYADRSTLWNAVEKEEKQWNAQVARRIVVPIPREIPKERYVELMREYCRNEFVSRGMVADLAIHDKGDGNPHAHILLTMRGMDEDGKWLPKAKKVYDLDENGERIRLPSGKGWKSHKERTVDWDEPWNAEKWRHDWADLANRYLEEAGREERLDLRSYERRGIDRIPGVHMGPAAWHLEGRGVRTNAGDLNREIGNANRLMQSIRQAVSRLRAWIAELKDKKKQLDAMLEEAREPDLSQLLLQYMDLRGKEREKWASAKGRLKGTVADFEKVEATLSYLKEKDIQTVGSLDAHLEEVLQKAAGVREAMRKKEKRLREIDMIYSKTRICEKYKAVSKEYASIRWKGRREKFAAAHAEELEAYQKAAYYLKKHFEGGSLADLASEKKRLEKECAKGSEALQAVQKNVKVLSDVRRWINAVLPPEERREPGKKPSVRARLRADRERGKAAETSREHRAGKWETEI